MRNLSKKRSTRDAQSKHIKSYTQENNSKFVCETSANGDIYLGSKKMNLKNGLGMFACLRKKTVYEGTFFNDMSHGIGY